MSVLLAVVAAPPTGWARDSRAEAAALFQAATEAHRRRDLVRAAETYEAAHAALPSAAALYNAGRAWQEAGQPARAANRLTEALALDGLSAVQASDARRRLGVIKRQVAQLTISGSRPGQVSVAGAPDLVLPASVHVPPGEARLRVTWSNGEVTEKTVAVSAGERFAVFIEAPLSPGPAAPAAPDSPWGALRFHFRLALGPGILNDSLEQSFGPGLRAVGSASGGILDSELAIGASINRHLIFGLAACTAWVTRPNVSFPSEVNPDLARIGAGAFVLTGPLVAWYIRDNRGPHVQAMLGAAGLNLADESGSRIDARINGSGLSAAAGWDWWLAGRWRSGAALRVTLARLESERTTHGLFLASLLWTATWDLRGR